MNEVKEQTVIQAKEVYVDCPHCGAREDGFVIDPRGQQFTCESCEQPYRIHPNADIEY